MSVTVLMTTYNCGSFISEAIKSILIQTYKDFEFLIVDDGSNDNTEELVKSYSDSRIKYIKIKHIGIGAAANIGLKLAKYDWIARMDADDICHPNRLESQIKYLEDDKIIISSWCAYFKNKKILFITTPPSDDSSIKKELYLHSIVNHLGSIFNKTFILNELGGYDEKLEAFIDYDLWLRARNKAKFFIVPQFLVFARIRSNSVSDLKLYKKDKLFYELQLKYLSSTVLNFENRIILGWREYFYGEKNVCREYWRKIKLKEWNYRMYIAYALSFLPKVFINYLKKLRLRLRLEYLLQKKTKYAELNEDFKKLLNQVSA